MLELMIILTIPGNECPPVALCEVLSGGEGIDLEPEEGDNMPGAVTLFCFSTTILLFSEDEWKPMFGELDWKGKGASLWKLQMEISTS